MPNAGKLLERKGTEVACLAPTATVLEAAELMNEKHIGSVLVQEGDKLVGIFTERDVMQRIVAVKKDPEKTKLKDVMTTAVACASPDTLLDEMRKEMREKRIRHIPVVDADRRVLGMISIGDLNREESDTQEKTIQYLEQFISVQ